MALEIIKFENDNCAPCKNVGDLLDSLDITYSKVKPFEDPDMAIKHRVRTVPVTLLMDGETEVARSVGFNPVELNQLVNQFKGN